MTAAIPHTLVRDWLAGRSLARGQPAPVPDWGGYQVDTGAPDEIRQNQAVKDAYLGDLEV